MARRAFLGSPRRGPALSTFEQQVFQVVAVNDLLVNRAVPAGRKRIVAFFLGCPAGPGNIVKRRA